MSGGGRRRAGVPAAAGEGHHRVASNGEMEQQLSSLGMRPGSPKRATGCSPCSTATVENCVASSCNPTRFCHGTAAPLWGTEPRERKNISTLDVSWAAVWSPDPRAQPRARTPGCWAPRTNLQSPRAGPRLPAGMGGGGCGSIGTLEKVCVLEYSVAYMVYTLVRTHQMSVTPTTLLKKDREAT